MGDKKSSIRNIYIITCGVINCMLKNNVCNNDCFYVTICKNKIIRTK